MTIPGPGVEGAEGADAVDGGGVAPVRIAILGDAPRAPALPEVGPACTGCGRCVAVCPPRVLWLETRRWKKTAVLHNPPACTGCARCAVVCPFHAIRMRRHDPAEGEAPGSADA